MNSSMLMGVIVGVVAAVVIGGVLYVMFMEPKSTGGAVMPHPMFPSHTMVGPGGTQHTMVGPGGTQANTDQAAAAPAQEPSRMQSPLEESRQRVNEAIEMQTMNRQSRVRGVEPASGDPALFSMTKDLDPLAKYDVPIEKVLPSMKNRPAPKTVKENLQSKFTYEFVKNAYKQRPKLETDRFPYQAHFGTRVNKQLWNSVRETLRRRYATDPEARRALEDPNIQISEAFRRFLQEDDE